MSLKTFTQDPSARLDYDIDWAPWLPEGDSIATATASAETGVTVEDPPAIDGTKTKVWVSDATAGQPCDVTVHIVTTEGREDDRSITIKGKEL